MTSTVAPAAPEVRDVERDDFRDALIREARQRARRRRLLYAGVAAGMAGAVVAVGIVASPTSSTSPAPTTVDDLMPPAGAAPSSPEPGELVAAVVKSDDGAWYLYSDGRLISIDHRATPPGWMEQRLTPAGVERVRSEFLASGLFDASNQPDGLPRADESPSSGPRVREGGRLLVAKDGTGAQRDAAPCGTRHEWGTPCYLVSYLRGLQLSIPRDEWAERELTRYVPNEYTACFTPLPPVVRFLPPPLGLLFLPFFMSRPPPSAPDLPTVLAQMPPPVFELLGNRVPTPDLHGMSPDMSPGKSCFDLTVAETRAVAASLIGAFGTPMHSEGFTYMYGWAQPPSVIEIWPLLPAGAVGWDEGWRGRTGSPVRSQLAGQLPGTSHTP